MYTEEQIKKGNEAYKKESFSFRTSLIGFIIIVYFAMTCNA